MYSVEAERLAKSIGVVESDRAREQGFYTAYDEEADQVTGDKAVLHSGLAEIGE